MIRIIIASCAAVLACGWTPAQDGRGGMREFKECDLARLEQRDYCAGCKAWPASDQIEKGQCRKCKSKVEKQETCIKIYWACFPAHREERHGKNCKETPSLALVWLECDACKGRALKEADVKHKEKCEGKLKKACDKTGKFPHGEEEKIDK